VVLEEQLTVPEAARRLSLSASTHGGARFLVIQPHDDHQFVLQPVFALCSGGMLNPPIGAAFQSAALSMNATPGRSLTHL